jgi:hypothetical protein
MTSISLNRLWLLALALVAASAPAGDLLRHDLFARPSRTTLPMASESQAVWSPTLTAVVVAGDGSMATDYCASRRKRPYLSKAASRWY